MFLNNESSFDATVVLSKLTCKGDLYDLPDHHRFSSCPDVHPYHEKTQRQGIQISIHISDFSACYSDTCSKPLLSAASSAFRISVFTFHSDFSGLATLQVLVGKSKQKREANARFRSGVSGLILGTGFLYLHTQTASDQLIAARTGISDLTLYLAIGCYALAALSFSANLNKLLKKQGTHFRNGVLGALFGTFFLFLDTQTVAGDLLANITGQNSLLLYAALVSYAIAVFSILMEGNKRLKVTSGNTKRAILCAGLGALLRYIHLRTTLDDLLGVSGWMGTLSFGLFIAAAIFLALDLFKSGKFKSKKALCRKARQTNETCLHTGTAGCRKCGSKRPLTV